jgi:hypothetical protein
MRHGPHQAAQKSTRTGSEESIALSNVAASASTIQGSAVWQKPQRGTPGALTGNRLRLPQLVHAIVAAALLMGFVARALVPAWHLMLVGGRAVVSRDVSADLKPATSALHDRRAGAHCWV